MEQEWLNRNELDRFKSILAARVAELEKVLRFRELLTVEPSPDHVDEVQKASDRALAISNLDRESQQLREARDAISRLRRGSFGVCRTVRRKNSSKAAGCSAVDSVLHSVSGRTGSRPATDRRQGLDETVYARRRRRVNAAPAGNREGSVCFGLFTTLARVRLSFITPCKMRQCDLRQLARRVVSIKLPVSNSLEVDSMSGAEAHIRGASSGLSSAPAIAAPCSLLPAADIS